MRGQRLQIRRFPFVINPTQSENYSHRNTMLDERRIRLKASEAKMCACDGARNARCQKRLPNCLSLPLLPMILERFRPTRLGGGPHYCRAAVCRECGSHSAEWKL